jgi:hypothetical protein
LRCFPHSHSDRRAATSAVAHLVLVRCNSRVWSPNIARTAAKLVPWKKILVETGLPIAIEEIKKLLARIGQPKTPDAEKLEEELRQTVRTLQDAFTETSQRIQMLAEAVHVLTARLTIALILCGVALIVGGGCWLFVLFHR